jgi:hypothetical protein
MIMGHGSKFSGLSPVKNEERKCKSEKQFETILQNENVLGPNDAYSCTLAATRGATERPNMIDSNGLKTCELAN